MRGVARGVMRGAQTPRHIFGVADLGYTASASDFDGTSDWLETDALSGVVNGKAGTASVWFRNDGNNSGNQQWISNNTLNFYVARRNDNKVRVQAQNSSNSTILSIATAATFTTSVTWHHALMAWDLGTAGRRHIFIDGVEDTVEATFTDDTIRYDQTGTDNWAVGARTGGSNKTNGCLSEVWFDDSWFDITIEANRLKFRGANGKPADLGSDGSTPTGNQPLIYLNNPFGTFEVNKGSAGDFSVTGALADCSTSPSD